MATPLPTQVNGTVSNAPIYHNVALRAPLKRAERDSDVKTTKRDVFPLAKPEKCVRNVFSTLHDYAWN